MASSLFNDASSPALHLLKVVPPAGVYTSAVIFKSGLLGPDHALRFVIIATWMTSMIFMALTHHRVFMAFKPPHVIATLGLFGLVRMLGAQVAGAGVQGYSIVLIRCAGDYLVELSLAAAALVVLYPEPNGHYLAMDRISRRASSRTTSRCCIPEYGLSTQDLDRESPPLDIPDWLSEVSAGVFNHMGPSSRAASLHSSAQSCITLSSGYHRIDPIKALSLAQLQAQIMPRGCQGHPDRTSAEDMDLP